MISGLQSPFSGSSISGSGGSPVGRRLGGAGTTLLAPRALVGGCTTRSEGVWATGGEEETKAEAEGGAAAAAAFCKQEQLNTVSCAKRHHRAHPWAARGKAF